MGIKLDKSLFDGCSKLINKDKLNRLLDQHSWLEKINNDDLQRVWIREVKGTSPFNVLDQLGSLAKKIELLIEDEKGFEVKEFVLNQHQSIINKLSNNKQFKLGEKYSSN